MNVDSTVCYYSWAGAGGCACSHSDNGGRRVEATGGGGKGVAGFSLPRLLTPPTVSRLDSLRLRRLVVGGARAKDDVLLN